jgi:hypothetical protein
LLPAPAAVVDLQSLRLVAAWIRDELDPVIAREGPEAMHPDDVLALHRLLQSLQRYQLIKSDIAFSRIHYALREIAGKSSRWPHGLADESDQASVVANLSYTC